MKAKDSFRELYSGMIPSTCKFPSIETKFHTHVLTIIAVAALSAAMSMSIWCMMNLDMCVAQVFLFKSSFQPHRVNISTLSLKDD